MIYLRAVGVVMVLAVGVSAFGAVTAPATGPSTTSPAHVLPTGAVLSTTNKFNVKELGAKGDGTTKDMAAIQKVLDDCAAKGGGEVDFPAGRYLTGTLKIGAKTTLRLEKDATIVGSPDVADYPVMKVRWEGEWRDGHSALLSAQKVDDVAIVGEGTIQGPPQALAGLRPDNRGNVRGPSIFEPIEVHGLTLDGFTVRYQGMWSIHLTYCENVLAHKVVIRSSGTNGDGFDIDSTKHVLLDQCDLDGGDDAISLKSGRGMEAVRVGRPTEDVIIRKCTLASSNFAGLGIGTEMSGGVRDILVDRCTFGRCRQNGIFIKGKTNRGGFIEDFVVQDCTFTNQAASFLVIDMVSKGIEATEPVTGDERFPRLKNLVFKNNKVDNVGTLVSIADSGANTNRPGIDSNHPIDGLVISGLTGTARKGFAIANVNNLDLENIQLTVPGALLTLTNANPAAGVKLDEASVRKAAGKVPGATP